jgi:hypothetical protein
MDKSGIDEEEAEAGWGPARIRRQNQAFGSTGGVSAGNRDQGFRPAYRHRKTGLTVLSTFADGRPAPIHILEGLPEQWLLGFDKDGLPIAVDVAVEAGFVRDGRFYTREDAACLLAARDGDGEDRATEPPI